MHVLGKLGVVIKEFFKFSSHSTLLVLRGIL